jgi:hypothetical protein
VPALRHGGDRGSDPAGERRDGEGGIGGGQAAQQREAAPVVEPRREVGRERVEPWRRAVTALPGLPGP